MNFFKLYIGDYQRDTGALSLAEHGAYMMMLQHYYATELPLPTGAALYRLMRAQTKLERDAIDAIAERFWVEKDGGLVNSRAIVEIDRAVRQRDVNREIGKRGGRPPKTAQALGSLTEHKTESVTESVSESKPNDNPSHSHSQKEQDQTLLSASADPVPYEAIVALYHELLPMLPQVRKLTKARKAKIKARWHEDPEHQDLAYWRRFFTYAAASDFLTGRSGRWTACDFEWLVIEGNHVKVIEGKYEMREAA